MLRDKLVGLAKTEWKDDLHTDDMREKLCLEEGVSHLMTYLRGKTFREAQHVYYWRMFQLLRLRRGKMDFKAWIIKYKKVRERLAEAYMDLLPDIYTTDEGKKVIEEYELKLTRHTIKREDEAVKIAAKGVTREFYFKKELEKQNEQKRYRV